jgi:hypothetical protein
MILSYTDCKSIYLWAYQEVGPIVQTLRITELHPPTQIIILNPKIAGLYTSQCSLYTFLIHYCLCTEAGVLVRKFSQLNPLT